MAVWTPRQRGLIRYESSLDFYASNSRLDFGTNLPLAYTTSVVRSTYALAYMRSYGGGGIGYIYSIASGSTIRGGRINTASSGTAMPDDPTGRGLVCAGHSTGASGQPAMNTSNIDGGGANRQGAGFFRWFEVATATLTGLLANSDITGSVRHDRRAFTIAKGNAASPGNGTGTATAYTAGGRLVVGNRDDNTRNWDGYIACFAQWSRELRQDEFDRIQRHGPLSVPDGMILCWANGRDWGPLQMQAQMLNVREGPAPPYGVLLDAGRSILVPVSSGASGIPVLSAPLLDFINANSAVPKVTVTFS